MQAIRLINTEKTEIFRKAEELSQEVVQKMDVEGEERVYLP